MRVLTVRQPWAWAIVHGGKDVENRSRNIAGDYRGPVAIHVALRDDDEWDEHDASAFIGVCPDRNKISHVRYACAWCNFRRPLVWRQQGHIIGVADLVDAHQAADCWDSPSYCSRWADGAWHLVLANPRPLAEPIPFRGALGLRRLDEATVQRVLEAAAS